MDIQAKAKESAARRYFGLPAAEQRAEAFCDGAKYAATEIAVELRGVIAAADLRSMDQKQAIRLTALANLTG